MDADAPELSLLAERALELIPENALVGLGSGRAATAFVSALGQRVRTGFAVRGVPTSEQTATLARQLGIPLATPDEVEWIDVTVDGADEVDPVGNLIKGYGGALVREKIVAVSSRRVVILVGAEKLVPVLGSRGIVPVEVVPFGLALVRRRLEELGFPARPRMTNDQPFVTDNGNHILDCTVGALPEPTRVDQLMRTIPGVVGTGLFLELTHTILVQHGDAIEVRRGNAPDRSD